MNKTAPTLRVGASRNKQPLVEPTRGLQTRFLNRRSYPLSLEGSRSVTWAGVLAPPALLELQLRDSAGL